MYETTPMMGRMKPTSLTQKPCVAVLHYGGGSGVVLLHDSNVVVPHQNSNPVLEFHPELQFKNFKFSSRAIIFKFLILISNQVSKFAIF